ncbi:hypothetical protein GCM10025751_55330 [Haladaptatus pallidirubidus]|uniref:Uncharacterized protein n=1 Tax=Haladaptatus pallidirubidus TaxID=1008152 RepID=A0AAV3URQ8_9EURY
MIRWLSILVLFALTRIPVVSAHGATATGGLSQWHGILLVFGGIVLLGGTILFKRTDRISPTLALSGVFVGLVVTALGAILFEALSPEVTYSAASMPFPRSWYLPMALSVGCLIIVSSLVIGWLQWPTRPRYTFLGILMGLWIAYPYLIPGHANDSHPLGYAIVLGTPILVGYVIWKDAGSVLYAVMRDPVARWFGIGVGVVVALFFISVTGYLSFFPEEGLPHERVIVVLPAIYQLVTWPTLEIYLPHIPLFVAISPGQLIVVGLLSTLIGLNAAFIARHWRVEERAGLTQSTAGAGAIVGSCTCGCCGPLVAKVAVLAAGPSIAAPLYWVFVDTASPLSALFIVASIILFAGSLVYSVEMARQPGQSAAIVPAD